MAIHSRRPDMDAGRHHRGKLGFVVLATEQTIEEDVFGLAPRGVGVHFARLSNPDSITPETLRAHESQLPDLAATLLPDGSLDVICYACTSGSFVMGEARVREALQAGAPSARPTTMTTAVIDALHVLGARRIVVATPYIEALNLMEADYFAGRGFDVLDVTGLGLERDSDMVRVTPAFLFEFALGLDRDDTDALFVSCGALRALEIIEPLERELGKPVVTSNQAMIWHTLRMLGVDDRLEGVGHLLQAH